MVHDVTVFKIILFKSKPGVRFFLHFENVISFFIEKNIHSIQVVFFKVLECLAYKSKLETLWFKRCKFTVGNKLSFGLVFQIFNLIGDFSQETSVT